jgi:hypothetical protein
MKKVMVNLLMLHKLMKMLVRMLVMKTLNLLIQLMKIIALMLKIKMM